MILSCAGCTRTTQNLKIHYPFKAIGAIALSIVHGYPKLAALPTTKIWGRIWACL
jgi:hypothetical protein